MSQLIEIGAIDRVEEWEGFICRILCQCINSVNKVGRS